MPGKGFRHWFPRVLVLGSVVALALPTTGYVAKLGRDEFIIWCAEVVWVLTLPTVFVATLLVLFRLLRKSRQRPPGPEATAVSPCAAPPDRTSGS